MSSQTPDAPAPRIIDIAPDMAPERIDRYLAGQFEDLSRSRLKALIEDGRLQLDGAPMRDPSAKTRPGGRYVLHLPPPRAAVPKPQDIPLSILYEDAHLVVLDKKAGMTVHPAAGNWSGTLVHALLHHCAGGLSGIGGVERPGIVHRLDKDTSGVMVVAKSDAAHQGLSAQFAAHSVERAYLAAVRGAPNPRAGRIETRLARSPRNRKKQAVVRDPQSSHGRLAITNYTTRRTFGQIPGAPAGTAAAALLTCRLETGRTHQIRVHMAHIGCPLLGDQLYGKDRALARIATPQGEVLKDFRRQALHAAVLGFVHPLSGEQLRFETPPPKDMQRLIKFLERL